MIFNKRQIFILVAKDSAKWRTVLAARDRIKRREVEQWKMETLQKWEDDGGEALFPLAKALV